MITWHVWDRIKAKSNEPITRNTRHFQGSAGNVALALNSLFKVRTEIRPVALNLLGMGSAKGKFGRRGSVALPSMTAAFTFPAFFP